MDNKKEVESKEQVFFKYAFKNKKNGNILFTNVFNNNKNYILLNIELNDILTYE